jgi:hypothetical protein
MPPNWAERIEQRKDRQRFGPKTSLASSCVARLPSFATTTRGRVRARHGVLEERGWFASRGGRPAACKVPYALVLSGYETPLGRNGHPLIALESIAKLLSVPFPPIH